MKLKQFLDPFAIIILVCLSINIAYHFLSTEEGQKGSFYQSRFAPAVMQACGYGYSLPTKTIPSLEQFLLLKKKQFNCYDIPQGIQTSPANQDIFLIEQHYLLSTVAFVWKILGVDWGNVSYVNILLYVLTIIGAYFVFRLGMDPFFAFLASFLLLKSNLNLAYLPHLRDYSVAPFMLWFTWLLGLMVTKNCSFRNYSLLTIFTGILLGVAIGFRSDSFVFIPPLIITILFFLPKRANLSWLHKLFLLIIFSMVLMIVAAPILLPMSHSGSLVAPMILEGLMEHFTIRLGLSSSPIYALGGIYSDTYANLLIRDYAQRILHEANPSLLQFNHMSKSVLLEWMFHFPADLIIRWYASVYDILQPSLSMPDSGMIGWLKSNFLSQYSLYFTFGTLTILAFLHCRLAIFCLFFILFFGGYPTLQFDPRHYFYLEFMSLWCVGFLLQILLLIFWRALCKEKLNRVEFFFRIKVVFLFWLMVLLFGIVALWVAHFYQTQHLRFWFNQYFQAKTKRIPTSEKVSNHLTLIKVLRGKKNKIYLKVSLSSECSNKVVKLRFKFQPALTENFTTDLLVNNYGRRADILFPIYSMDLFEGIEILTKQRQCIQEIREVNSSEKMTLHPILWFPENWQHKRLYSILARKNIVLVVDDDNAPPFRKTDLTFDNKTISPLAGDLISLSKNVKQRGSEIFINGFFSDKDRYSYVAQWQSQTTSKDDNNDKVFLAEGIVERGGISVGLINQKTGSWDPVINMPYPGTFLFYIEPKPGSYVPTLANGMHFPGYGSVKIKVGFMKK